MEIIRKFEYEVDVWVDAWGNGDEDVIETFTLVSTEEYFSEEGQNQRAENHGGFLSDNMRVLKSW